MKLTSNEIHRLHAICKKNTIWIDSVERKSAREYDLSFSGNRRDGTAFSAWLPLHHIANNVLWMSREVASMTDYPEMVLKGDWSGVRDSSEEKIWQIFEKYFALS